MKMEKTIEEIRSSVLAYCKEVCPEIGSSFWTDIKTPICCNQSSVKYWVVDGVSVWPKMHDLSSLPRLYRLLGLETRDAVEAERARLSKRYKSRIKRLRSEDDAKHRIVIEVKEERISELQAKSANLVEALDQIRKPAMIISLGKATNRERSEQLTEDHKRVRLIAQNALEAYKKGGPND